MLLTALIVVIGGSTTTLPFSMGSILAPSQDYLYLSTSPHPRPPLPIAVSSSPAPRLFVGESLVDTELDESKHYPTGLRSYDQRTIFGTTESSSFPEMGNRSLELLMKEELAEYRLRDPLSIAIPMTFIYMLILISGLVGNISTCFIIAKTSYMHTATNYYLFSLAMSDLLLLISGLPQEIYHIWIKYPYIFGEAFCVIRGLAAETSANATVLTITAFTVERFLAIVYPLKSHKFSQLSRVVRVIGIIWIVAFCLAIPQAAQFGVKDHPSRLDPNLVLIKGAWCTLVREVFPYAFQISICVFFAIPMTIITVLYILIGLKLRRSRKGPMMAHAGSQELGEEPRTQNRHSQSHVIRMLVAVVVAFFICWAPFHAQRLMALYGKSQRKEEQRPSRLFMIIYQGVIHVSGILYYISTCINPILYHIMSNKFRQAFKDTMGSLCGRRENPLQNQTYSAVSHRTSRMGVIHRYTNNKQKKRQNPNNRSRDLLATSAAATACVVCTSTTSSPCTSCRMANSPNVRVIEYRTPTTTNTNTGPVVENNRTKSTSATGGGGYKNGLDDQHAPRHNHHLHSLV